jgi:hypothetical protein
MDDGWMDSALVSAGRISPHLLVQPPNLSDFFLTGKFSPNFHLKSMKTPTKDFSSKKWPKFVRFQENKISKSPNFYNKFQ